MLFKIGFRITDKILKKVKPTKVERLYEKGDWKKVSKKDGMILQRNPATGIERLVVEKTGKVLPVVIEG